jgi:hypothetical protein
MYTRGSQSYAQRLWQPVGIHHWCARVHRLPLFSGGVSFSLLPNALAGYSQTVALGDIRMKAILFSFVRSFDFELAVPPTEIIRKTMIVARPFLKSDFETDFESGPQLPLVIRPAKSD